MSTRAELRNRTKDYFKRDDKDSEIDSAINDALREMAGCLEVRKLQDQRYVNLVVDQEDYALPDDLLRIRHPIRLIDRTATNSSSASFPLRFITKQEYDEYEPNPNASTIDGGEPFAYCIWKNCILLTDIPDQANKWRLEINMGKEIVILSSDVDEPAFNDSWDETIVAGTLTRMFALVQLYQDAEYWRNIYVNGFTGDQGQIVGGLKLLRMLDNDQAEAPLKVKFNNI